MRYVFRHIRRAWIKSLLCIVLAAAFVGAVGQFMLSTRDNRARVENMYDTVEVYAYIVGLGGATNPRIPYQALDVLLDTGFASYYHAETEGPCKWMDTQPFAHGKVYTFVDPERFGRAGSITYADGWDEESFLASKDAACVVSESALESKGIALGDELLLSGVEEDFPTGIRDEGVTFTVVGSFDGSLTENDVFVPYRAMALLRFEFYQGRYNDAGIIKNVIIRVDNALLRDGRKAYLDPQQAVLEQAGGDVAQLGVKVLDEELKSVVEPLDESTSQMEMLLPLVAAAAVIIGAVVPALVIVQRSGDAALFRALGTRKTRVRFMLAAEQVLLCVVGLIVGAVVLGVMHGFGEGFTAVGAELAIFAAACAAVTAISCVVSAWAVSNRKPLELLQAKE